MEETLIKYEKQIHEYIIERFDLKRDNVYQYDIQMSSCKRHYATYSITTDIQYEIMSWIKELEDDDDDYPENYSKTYTINVNELESILKSCIREDRLKNLLIKIK
jgi:hypothetical protein